MGLNRIWNTDATQINDMKLKQIAVLAGDGIITHKNTYEELRLFFTRVDSAMICRFMKECLSDEKEDKFDDRGFVLQDLINEVGRRFGYEITHGMYKGKKGENGFDGLWRNADGFSIVMESKTSDAYTPNLNSIIGYREKLIKNNQIEKNRSSILIVIGKDDKNIFSNLIKGSNEMPNIRAISIDSLCKLLEIYMDSNRSKTVQKKIMELLMPHDYIQLDNLVDLVFLNEKDNTSREVNEVHEKTNAPVLPDIELSIGKLVYTAMKNLSESGYAFTNEQIANLTSKKWCHQTLKFDFPLLKSYDPSNPKGHHENGHQRFYAETFTFGDNIFYVTKELYPRSKELFIKWYKSL